MNDTTGIAAFLTAHAEKQPVSFHMPGHKGVLPAPLERCAPYDFTEVPLTDSLYEADGALHELEERFSRHPEQIGITNRFLSTLGGAPVCLLVFMLKPDYPDRDGAMQSVSAAIENVLLAAWAKGIGSCWLSAPQRMGFGPAFQRRFAPDKGEFVAAVTLGYPDQQPKMPPRRDGRYLIV